MRGYCKLWRLASMVLYTWNLCLPLLFANASIYDSHNLSREELTARSTLEPLITLVPLLSRMGDLCPMANRTNALCIIYGQNQLGPINVSLLEYCFMRTITDIEIELIGQSFTWNQSPSILFLKNSKFQCKLLLNSFTWLFFSILFYATCHTLCIIINNLSNAVKTFWKSYECLGSRQNNWCESPWKDSEA